MTAPLLIIGSVAIDTITTPAKPAHDTLGGSAVFAALAAKHFGPVMLLSALGPDFPDILRHRLQQHGVSLEHTTLNKDGKNFRWTGIYDATLGSRQSIGFELGVLATTALQVPATAQAVRYAMMATYDPSRELEVLRQLKTKPFVATDSIQGYITDERYKAILSDLYRQSSLITLDSNELKLFTGKTDEASAVQDVLKLGMQYVIIKYGKGGSRLYSRSGQSQFVGIYASTAVETTGAGDTYLGTIMAYLNKMGKHDFETLVEAMTLGAAAASITIEGDGTSTLENATFAEIRRRRENVEMAPAKTA